MKLRRGLYVLSIIACVLFDNQPCESSSVSRVIKDQNSECYIWANTDEECVNNPRFMWSACLQSCLKYAGDASEECKEWAEQGECTADPAFIHVNCPESCNYAIAWSPWVRKQLEIDSNILSESRLDDVNCGSQSDVFTIAEIMKDRLVNFVKNSDSATLGLSANAPSEFLGMVGLTDAVIYTLRLYQLVLEYQGTSADTNNELLLSEVTDILGSISTLLASGWSSDPIMRSLPRWVNFLAKLSLSLRRTAVETSSVTVEATGESSVGNKICLTLPHGESSAVWQISNRYNPGHLPPNLAEANLDDDGNLDSLNLHNGVKLPIIGLGTWLLEQGSQCEDAVYSALQIGYRMIDTAQAYGNEASVGWALRRALDEGVIKSRSDVFIATKLSDEDSAGYEGTTNLIHDQLKQLQTEYIDLYMIHSPLQPVEKQRETWRAIEDLYDKGILKSIGLSNFDGNELRSFLGMKGLRIKPMVIQNKFDVYHVGKQIDPRGDDIVLLAKSHDIRLVAYSPFSSFPFVMMPQHDPIVKYVSDSRKTSQMTPSQVLLRWTIQQGVAVIPRSSSPHNLAENIVSKIKTFELSVEEMLLLSSIAHLTSSPMSVAVTY